MNSQTMLSRENLIEVLLGTVKAYYRQVRGVEVELSLKKQKGFQTLYLYHTPLFVSGFPMSKGAKEFLYTEYNIRGNILKYLIGKLGVFVVTNSFGVGAARKIYIQAKELVNTTLFISPCNRTIRFYDFETDTVDCILKEGYQPLFLNNQLDFRMSCQYEFVPKVLKRGETWYTEEIMHGHALARVRDAQVHEQSLAIVGTYISRLAADTLEHVEGHAYFRCMRRELMELCAVLLDRNDGLNETVARQLDSMELQVSQVELLVPTCISHGDLQEGNIWVTNDARVLIYDWETCRRRSVWYDPATLHYSLHNRRQGFDLMRHLRTDGEWLANDPCKRYTDTQLECIAFILLMEDILFQMQEAIQLTQAYGPKRAKEVLTVFADTMEEDAHDVEA